MATTPKPRARKAEAAPASPPAGTNHPVITDPELVTLAEEYAKAAPEKARLEKRLKELKPVLLQAMGNAPLAYAGKHVLVRGEVQAVPEVPGAKITRSMVGGNLPSKPGRAGYLTLEVR